MFKTFLKTHFSDNYLRELRKQTASYIPQNSRVIDIGCGTGILLSELSPRIKYGLGIDTDSSMIDFARKKYGHRNLEFRAGDSNYLAERTYDIAVLSLIVHSLDKESEIRLLKKASSMAEKVIIADYFKFSLLVHIDEIIAGHYNNFKEYRKNKMENLIEEAGLLIEKARTNYKNLGIWICSS